MGWEHTKYSFDIAGKLDSVVWDYLCSFIIMPVRHGHKLFKIWALVVSWRNKYIIETFTHQTLTQFSAGNC